MRYRTAPGACLKSEGPLYDDDPRTMAYRLIDAAGPHRAFGNTRHPPATPA
ncbi:hypothetical protein OHS59_43740 [Streptomyces sp. NBC_00414]|uniref:hypothetical protein n=1 Tax=Streptomyces sp. NBC_00414 TaxID=2975739 RepID=UPI002E1E92B0